MQISQRIPHVQQLRANMKKKKKFYLFICLFVYLFIFLAVLGFELRAYTLSHSTSPFFVMGFFEIGSCELYPQAGFSHNLPDLFLLCS
jgi:Na+/proline symporter